MNGSEATSYTWDKASRLTSIVHAGQTTSYVYDVAGRLTSKTLPNGIVQTLSYDDASRLTAITYSQPGGAVVETISYTYDANGRRLSKTSASNSTAQETPFTATYDDADRMTSVVLKGTGPGGADQNCTLAYDDNGKLQTKTCGSDVTSYTWDSRDRLRTITGPDVNAAFDYDVLGRRTTRTVNGVTTTFVYDGVQAIGQTKDGIQTSLFTGLQIDEVIATYAASANRTMLTDALGSVIAETKDDQSTATRREYTPFGQGTQSGEASANDSQYTGRENDGTGLYFYRARYYDAQLKRFVSQDPIGLSGGINEYEYVDGNPVSNVDPLGLKTLRCTKPLHALGPKYGPIGYKYGPLLYHQYSCVVDKNGKVTCGGQDRGSNGEGKPSNDVLNPPGGECEETQPDNDCFEVCLVKEWARPTRPKYGIPFGTDCQEYDDDVNELCRKQCKIK